MNTDFVRSALRDHPQLLSRMVRFNVQLAHSVHPERLPEVLPAERWRALAASPQGERRLSEFLAAQIGLSAEGYWEFAEPSQRIALLDLPELARLTSLTGAAVRHPLLTGLIGGAAVREAKAALGEDVLEFARKRAPLLVPAARSIPGETTAASSAGASGGPGGGGIPAPGHVADDSTSRHGSAVTSVLAAGREWLFACLGADSPELLRRFELKWPPGARPSPLPGAGHPPREAAWRLVKRIVLTEFPAELARCFT